MAFPLMPIPILVQLGAGGFEISVRASGFSGIVSTRSVAYPTDTQSGDLIILICGTSGSIPASPTDVASWNLVSSTVGANQPSTKVYWQVASASPPANITITTGGSNASGLAGIMLRIPQAAFDASGDFSTSNPPSPTGPTASGGLAIAFYRSTTSSATWTVPSGMELLHTNTGFNCAIFTQEVTPGPVGAKTSTPSAGTPNGIIITIKRP